MTPAEITAFLPIWPPPFYYDASYAVPTARWIFADFFPAWALARHRAGRGAYSRRNDCDNFARACAVAAQDAWSDSAGVRSEAEGLAFGEFCYHRADGRGAHAINAAITDEGLLFLEPQTGERLALTPAEISSCFRASF